MHVIGNTDDFSILLKIILKIYIDICTSAHHTDLLPFLILVILKFRQIEIKKNLM